MFVRTTEKPNGKIYLQILESYRQADKLSENIVRHDGQVVTEMEVEKLKKALSRP